MFTRAPGCDTWMTLLVGLRLDVGLRNIHGDEFFWSGLRTEEHHIRGYQGPLVDTLPHSGGTPHPSLRKLGATTIEVAIEEMKAETLDASDRFQADELRRALHAVVWLGSGEATPWIEGIGADHRETLKAIEWAHHARRILDSGTRVSDAQRLLLETGIEGLVS